MINRLNLYYRVRRNQFFLGLILKVGFPISRARQLTPEALNRRTHDAFMANFK